MWQEAQPIAPNCFSPSAAAARQSSGRSVLTVGGGSVAWKATRAETSPGVVEFGHAALGEIVCSRPSDAEALGRLHAVMDVERVDGELPQRGEDALAAERADGQVRIDAVDRIKVNDSVRVGDDPAELHALADEVGAHVLARLAGFLRRLRADALQVGGHLARKKLDEPGTHERGRVALARERGVDVVELGALETLGHEHVGDVVARAPDHRIVVTAEAGVGIRTARAGERRIDAALAFCRDDRLRRLRPPRPVDSGEFRLEQRLASLDEGREGGGAGGGDAVEIDVRPGLEDPLVPTSAERHARQGEADGRGAGGQNSQDSLHIPSSRFLDAADR